MSEVARNMPAPTPKQSDIFVNLLTPGRGKRAFLQQLPASAKVLDIGCGSGSPQYVKTIRPDVFYVGVDICDHLQTETSKTFADRYVLTASADFARTIADQGEAQFDAVISAHNLEHCEAPDEVLKAMCRALRPGGQLYLSFPSEASVRMPSREGTLNFYDDPTHRTVPDWSRVLRQLGEAGMRRVFTAQRYRPWRSLLIGLVFEPFVAPLKKKAPRGGTWALYGFESIIWAVKQSAA